MTVDLFIPCFVDQVFPRTGLAAVRLLEMAGCTVRYRREQTCCGQPAFNSGYHDEAAKLAERFVRLFADADVVMAPSASCVAMVKKHYSSLDLDTETRQLHEELKGRVFELSQFLVDELKIASFPSRYPHTVAYHTSCHGYRELGVYDQPLQLLRGVKEMELVEPDDLHACCGFGGTFSAKFPELSVAMGEDKIIAIERTGADVITATDDSCLMHLAGMLQKRKSSIRTLHYARILAGGEFLV